MAAERAEGIKEGKFMKKKKIAVLVGSLRRESYCRKMAAALTRLAPDSLDLELVEIGALEMYNQDLDDGGTPPASWTEFRTRILGYDGLLFITPEYNRSISGVLKNALDVGSRPYGRSVWNGKPGAVVSVSPGKMGAFGANQHLRQVLVVLNVPTLQQPEAYIGGAAELFRENGALNDAGTEEFLKGFMTAFADWAERNAPIR